ncbi:MAG: hypothetical protein LAT62_08880 [Natronospirillum sp.]|uniref:hypothetical protein n=1 Tax=Natronospirillum sp. TaxID=2812955 RepID=UPI0025F4C7BB|nr:hypothetical protein [Natronospirillum sp.]MCH8552036.1 hypothetical protein [Natronospirillum sp.]
MPQSWPSAGARLLTLGALCLSTTLTAQPWSGFSPYERDQESWQFWDAPTMRQSGDLTRFTYQGWTSAGDILRQTRFANDEISPLVIDVGMWVFVLPHPAIWMRNEWQRDLLRAEGIDSRSDARFLWSHSTEHETYVRGVTDEQLTDVRASNPGQYTRLGSVRYEATQQLVSELSEASYFNYGVPRYRFAKAYLTLQDTISLYRCTDDDFTLPGDESERSQDIIGHDCLHWTWSLHGDSSDEHERYIGYDDLDSEARDYLDRALLLSLINFVDTQYFDETNQQEANRLSFEPTPFGRRFGWHHLRWQQGMQVGWDVYWQQNDEQNLPAARISVIDYPVSPGTFTGRLAGWQQPRDLNFRTESNDAGWAIELRYSQPVMQRLRLTGDWYYKSDGWYPGVQHLDSGRGWRLGAEVRLF